ncbi:L-lactate permease [Halorubrum tebenquichense]|uniref:Lactate permease family protein n=1 Tax=Halorubrum tebenquichense DSM 14210 TaxID=1227485 RepID=M0DZ59_9EURY|nr:lactate permease family protein [Halorubrum tebenquichense DSM 14210]
MYALLPVSPLYAGLALVPLALLLFTLVVLRWRAHEAASVGMFAAAAVALAAYGLSPEALSVASGKGVWDAVFVLYVIVPALVFYHVIERADGFEALRTRITAFTENELFLVLAFGWVFVSFMQSISGFGTPIVVVAPLLLALGVKPVYSVAIPLVGHAWANTFGTLGVAWLALVQVVEMQSVAATALALGVLLWIPNLVGGLSIAWLYGRWEAVRYAFPMVAVVSLIHGGGQLAAVTVIPPEFANFFAASVGLLALAPLAAWSRYATPTDAIERRPVMAESIAATDADGSSPTAVADGGTATAADAADPADDGLMSLPMAALPFVALAAAAFVTAVVTPLSDALGSIQVGLSFPEIATSFGVVTEATAPYSPFSPLTHPGTFLLLSALVAFVVYRRKGHYEAATARADEPREAFSRTVLATAIPASIAVVSFLVMAKVMDHSGQVLVLAESAANVATPATYGFFSPLIGSLGAFMTSSNTASNILFGGLQQQTAAQLGGLSEPLILAGQSAGGAIGNAISPGNVILGTTAAGIVGREGDVLRVTIPWVALVGALVGLVIVALNAAGLLGVA